MGKTEIEKSALKQDPLNSAVLSWDDVRRTNATLFTPFISMQQNLNFQISVHIYTHMHVDKSYLIAADIGKHQELNKIR